jgi:hypothetical protein
MRKESHAIIGMRNKRVFAIFWRSFVPAHTPTHVSRTLGFTGSSSQRFIVYCGHVRSSVLAPVHTAITEGMENKEATKRAKSAERIIRKVSSAFILPEK